MEAWRERAPEGFLYSVKFSRYGSHMKNLQAPGETIPNFVSRVRLLGDHLGPVLVQLPPRFACDTARLSEFLALLPEDRRFALEFRDPSWHCQAVYDLLAARNAAFCPFELAKQRSPRVATADFVYVRLHGRKARYQGAYSERALADWAGWLGAQMAEGRDAYVYFDNTDEADHAVRNAMRLDELLSE